MKKTLLSLCVTVAMGCGVEDSSGGGGEAELSYTVVIDAEQGLESSLLIRLEGDPRAQVYGTDGVFREMPISASELSVLIDKFSEGAVISDYSDINATSDIGLPAPDCLAEPRICQAIEIAYNRASGVLGPSGGRELKVFVAKNPVNLLPDTAELILSLERLRVRVHTEGAVVQ